MALLLLLFLLMFFVLPLSRRSKLLWQKHKPRNCCKHRWRSLSGRHRPVTRDPVFDRLCRVIRFRKDTATRLPIYVYSVLTMIWYVEHGDEGTRYLCIPSGDFVEILKADPRVAHICLARRRGAFCICTVCANAKEKLLLCNHWLISVRVRREGGEHSANITPTYCALYSSRQTNQKHDSHSVIASMAQVRFVRGSAG